MARPLYESNEDLKNEKIIAETISNVFGMKLKKLHKKFAIDFMAFDLNGDNAVAVIEVKRRKNNHNKYSSVILSLTKFNRGIEFYQANDLAFIFVVQFDDGIFVYEYSPNDLLMIVFGGRTDRNDEQDFEPVVQIPINKMERL